MFAIRSLSRFKAFAAHLGISALVAVAALAVMLAFWYPPPLFEAMGGIELAILIVGVDVCIGPLITLIVFDPRKRDLLFDLSIIAVLQIAALVYGIYAMHAGRPVFTVFNGKQFAVVSAADIDPVELEKGRTQEFSKLSWFGPRLVAADEPTNPEEKSDLLWAGLSGLGVQHLPKYYVSYDERRQAALGTSKPLRELVSINQERGEVVNTHILKLGRSVESLRYLAIQTKRKTMTALVDAKDGSLIALIPVDPR